MHLTPTTKEDAARVAARHFAWLKGSFLRQKLSLVEREAEADLGNNLVAAALALAPGDTVSPLDWLKAAGYGEPDAQRAGELFPYLSSGNLNLMEMEFSHAELGVLPLDEVRSLLETDEPRPFKGVNLTRDAVFVAFRRLPLD